MKSKRLVCHCEERAKRVTRQSHSFRPITLLIFLLLTACTERRQAKQLQTSDKLLNNGDISGAVESLAKVIALKPDSIHSTKAYYKMGSIAETYLQDIERAIFNYQEYIRHASATKDNLAIYEVRKKIAALRFDEMAPNDKAIAAYSQLLELYPEGVERDFFQWRLAESYFRQNHFEEARSEYQRLGEHFPNSNYLPKARYQIGNSYYLEGKYEIALSALKQMLKLHPESEYSVEAQFQIGQCLEQLEQWDKALNVYEQLKGRYLAADVLEFKIKSLKTKKK